MKLKDGQNSSKKRPKPLEEPTPYLVNPYIRSEDELCLGEASASVLGKDEDHTAVDLQREIQKEWGKELAEAMVRGKSLYGEEFYVVVLLRRERSMHNVIRSMFFPRRSCPTPDLDQTVFRYRHPDDLEFLWCVPDAQTCEVLKYYVVDSDPEINELAAFVRAFNSGELYLKALKLNGEDPEAPCRMNIKTSSQQKKVLLPK